ncbi:MAG: hypothetical protein Q9161_005083 [Pseudevernia consocians]
MQLSNILQLALLVASHASASPITGSDALTPNAADELVKRANPAPVSCGPTSDQRAWPLQSVQDAYNALVTNGALPNNQKPAAGTRYYPRQYGSGSNAPTDASVVTALNAISECATGQTGMKYFEFPLTDPVFTSGPAGSQGPDRVVAISPTPGQGQTRTFTYCLAMTHRGGTGPSDPSFRPCTNAP